MSVVEVCRILEVTLDYIAGVAIGCDAVEIETAHLLVRQKLETSERQWLALSSGIKRISIQICYITTFVSSVKVFQTRVIG